MKKLALITLLAIGLLGAITVAPAEAATVPVSVTVEAVQPMACRALGRAKKAAGWLVHKARHPFRRG
jgi:hypothetical protein